MLRRTGTNALGYTYPKENLILLEKGLTGKKKREVIAHEKNHLAKGEEGPFWGAVAMAAASLIGNNQKKQAEKRAAGNAEARIKDSETNQLAAIREGVNNALPALTGGYESAKNYLSPYASFGADQLTETQNWLKSPEGRFNAPTMDDVKNSAGYSSRLGAIENSAAAKGGLFSGNALRDIGDFGSREYEKEYGRNLNAYLQDLSTRMGLLQFGSDAARRSAGLESEYASNTANIHTGKASNLSGIYSASASPLANLALKKGGSDSRQIDDFSNTLGSAYGEYQGNKNWNDFLSRMGR